MKPRYRIVATKFNGEYVHYYAQHSSDGLAFFNIRPEPRITFEEAKDDALLFRKAQATDVGSDVKVLERIK